MPALILFVLLTLLVQGATLPHTHGGAIVGLDNQEHDLTLLAASGAVAPLPVVPIVFIAVVTGSLTVSAPPQPTLVVSHHAVSRAPPSA